MKRYAQALLMLIACFSICGCERLRTEYGYSYSTVGRKSVNGVAAFREMYKQKGWTTTHIKRLSYKANGVDAIVWFPEALGPPKERASRWLDQWLASQPRKLVFVVRGYESAESLYWQQARGMADPADRLEYRRRAAQSDNAIHAVIGNSLGKTLTNGWFSIDVGNQYSEARDFDGVWTEDVKEFPKRLGKQVTIRQYNEATDKADLIDEYRPPGNIQFQPLLESDGKVLAARLTCGQWGSSEVLVLSSAEYLVNLAMVNPENGPLAEQVIDETGAPTIAAFFRSDFMGARVSGSEEDELASGFELLTTWPLFVTTMHIFLILVLACIVLYPIFGRAQQLPKPSSANLGDHITAVSELMQRTGDRQYAKRQISDYFVKVRGEEAGPWVMPHDAPSAVAPGPQRAAAPPPNQGGEKSKEDSSKGESIFDSVFPEEASDPPSDTASDQSLPQTDHHEPDHREDDQHEDSPGEKT